MKRIATFVLALALAGAPCALAACSARRDSAEPTGAPTVTDPTGTDSSYPTLAEHLESEAFTEADAAIRGGEDLPEQLIYSVSYVSTTVEDPALIVEVWETLCTARIDPENLPGIGIEDGDVGFEFLWEDGRRYNFHFALEEYYYLESGQLADVKNPQVVREAMALAGQAPQDDGTGADAGAGAAATPTPNGMPTETSYVEIDFDGTPGFAWYFSWDADGDGVADSFYARYHDQGDEAPSYIELEMSNGMATGWIDRAYGIARVQEATDASGRYLVITYDQGDYYGHDAQAQCTVRLEGDELVVEELR